MARWTRSVHGGRERVGPAPETARNSDEYGGWSVKPKPDASDRRVS